LEVFKNKDWLKPVRDQAVRYSYCTSMEALENQCVLIFCWHQITTY
jgi:hypothetical protein